MSTDFSSALVINLNSRLGLRNAPIGHTALNLGVENGGETITKNFLNSNSLEIVSHNFPLPETLPTQKYLERVFELHNSVIKKIDEKWSNQFLISLGGDHSVSQISLSAVLNRFNSNDVGVVMFDSHADLHLPSTSPTGNFHGMWLRSFFDQFSQNSIDNKKIKPNQLRYVGNLLTEPEEDNFIKSNEITVYSSQNATKSKSQELSSWANQFKHLHISFDIDVFEEKISPATGTPNPSGLTKSQVLTMLIPLLEHSSISLDIVEFNPQKVGAEKSLTLIKDIFEPIINHRQS